MDLTQTIVPDSTQINADDLIAAPITVTIESVTAGNAEQPVNIHTVETPGRAYRPSKSMRRVLVSAWGSDTDAYVGRRLTLYREPSIKFGKDAVGGVRISHMSHIDRPLKVALTVSRGSREPFTVQPLTDAAPKPRVIDTALAGVTVAQTVDQVRAVWDAHSKSLDDKDRGRLADAMKARKAEIEAVDGAA